MPRSSSIPLVARATGILESQTVDIYVNPTFLPDVLAKDYDTLWTDARMKKVAAAAAKGAIAVEINDHYKLPSQSLLRSSKRPAADSHSKPARTPAPTTSGAATTAAR